MLETMTVEQRLVALEKEVADLKQRLEQMSAPKNWLDVMDRSRPNLPEAAAREFMELCAEIRRPIDP